MVAAAVAYLINSAYTLALVVLGTVLVTVLILLKIVVAQEHKVGVAVKDKTAVMELEAHHMQVAVTANAGVQVHTLDTVVLDLYQVAADPMAAHVAVRAAMAVEVQQV